MPILFIMLFLLGYAVTWAQQDHDLLIGAGGGYQSGWQFGSIPVYAISADCGLFTTGGLGGPFGSARFMLPTLFSDRSGLAAIGSWSALRGAFSAAPTDEQKIADPRSGEIVAIDRAYRLETHIRSLQLDLLFDYSPGRWHLLAGPWAGYQYALDTRQYDTIRAPEDRSFTGGGRSRPMPDGMGLTSQPLAFGFVASAGLEMTAGERIVLLPELSFRLMLSSPAEQAIWRGAMFGLGLSVLYAPASHPDRAIPAPSTLPAPPVARLSASIRIDGDITHPDSARLAMVEVTEVRDRRFTPLIPAIFFDRDSDVLAPRYADSAARSASGFDIDLLRDLGPVEVHHHNLDIIGSRLRAAPAAGLQIYRTASDETDATLGMRRAERVRAYLVRRWGIDQARLRIEPGQGPIKRSGERTEDGREENRRIELRSDDPSILAPIAVDRIRRTFNPPQITFVPTMEAEAGVLQWQIDVQQGGEPVADYGSDDNEGEGMDLAWRLDDARIDSIPSPITVSFTVVDSLGTTVVARDELPLAIVKRRSFVEHRGIIEADRTIYMLAAFDYDEAEPGAIDRDLLEDIVEDLSQGGRITIVGYTDRIGGEDYNLQLSVRRALSVATLLRRLATAQGRANIDIRVEGAGIETQRFTNDLPEGRMFSRGVQVIVERER